MMVKYHRRSVTAASNAVLLTWKTPVRKKRREPPPAATVFMSSCGAWIVTPAFMDGNEQTLHNLHMEHRRGFDMWQRITS